MLSLISSFNKIVILYECIWMEKESYCFNIGTKILEEIKLIKFKLKNVYIATEAKNIDVI